MEKAYDLKALGEMIQAKAKGKGLALAEEALEELGHAVYEGSKQWLTESATMSGTKVDDLLVPFITLLDTLVAEQLKKIDLGADDTTDVTPALTAGKTDKA